ncbi:MAG: response regulator transcription factor [Verrucomicrobiota bacterium]
MTITITIVEDHAAVRTSMLKILEDAPNCKCVGAFSDGEEALLEIPKLKPQVVLMDISLTGMNGVECVRQLAKLMELPQIIMLTVHEDPESIFNSLAAGAAGYLLKPVRAAQLLAAIKDVYGGGAPMTSNIARKVVQSFKRVTSAVRPAAENLSPREMDVLNYLVKGFSYKETAEALGLAYGTVHRHIEHIYHKLHVQSRAQAVARYLRV